jgi:hypothetical protein
MNKNFNHVFVGFALMGLGFSQACAFYVGWVEERNPTDVNGLNPTYKNRRVHSVRRLGKAERAQHLCVIFLNCWAHLTLPNLAELAGRSPLHNVRNQFMGGMKHGME